MDLNLSSLIMLKRESVLTTFGFILYSTMKSGILARFFDKSGPTGHFPRPFGVFYKEKKLPIEDDLIQQVEAVISSKEKVI